MSPSPDPDASGPQVLAERVAELMWAGDEASRALGMTLDAVGPGAARCSLTVEARHVNGVGTCHGGILFALADTAFAFACNAGNARTVAQRCTIDFVAPARVGDALVAEAREVATAGRSGVYDVEVRRAGADGADGLVALFRGASRAVSGHHVGGAAP